MTVHTSISHDKALVQELRDNPDFAVAYLRAAIDDDEPKVLTLALRQLAEAISNQ